MCDGCGCDHPKAPDDQAQRARQKAGGWHVHADGTVHRHDHSHGPSHPYVPGRASRVAAEEDVPAPAPALDDRKDNGADGTSGSSNASTGER
jgi:hypothetical protein